MSIKSRIFLESARNIANSDLKGITGEYVYVHEKNICYLAKVQRFDEKEIIILPISSPRKEILPIRKKIAPYHIVKQECSIIHVNDKESKYSAIPIYTTPPNRIEGNRGVREFFFESDDILVDRIAKKHNVTDIWKNLDMIIRNLSI